MAGDCLTNVPPSIIHFALYTEGAVGTGPEETSFFSFFFPLQLPAGLDQDILSGPVLLNRTFCCDGNSLRQYGTSKCPRAPLDVVALVPQHSGGHCSASCCWRLVCMSCKPKRNHAVGTLVLVWLLSLSNIILRFTHAVCLSFSFYC